MILQFLIVGLIVSAAITLTIVKLIRFFLNPVHKCEGCSGCSLEELKREMDIKKVNSEQ